MAITQHASILASKYGQRRGISKLESNFHHCLAEKAAAMYVPFLPT
jgi:hypothetical protein